jgi:diguanylate cyclase (GGDEF)-like protein/PAS domain S-box-containing protein
MAGARRRTRHRRVAAVLVVLALVAAVAAGREIAESQDARRATVTERFGTRHSTATRFVEAYLVQILAHQEELAVSAMQEEVTSTRFNEIARQNQFTSAELFDLRGRLLAVSPPDADKLGEKVGCTYSEGCQEYEYLQRALAGTPSVSDVVVSTSRGRLVIDFAVPYGTGSGRRVLSTGYAIDDTPLRPFVVGAMASYPSADVYLVDSRGVVITSNHSYTTGIAMTETAPVLARQMTKQAAGFIGDDGKRRYYVSGPVKGTGWKLVFALNVADLYPTLTPAQVKAPWVILFGFLLMTFGMIALFTRALAGRTQAEGEHARQQSILDTAGDAFIGMDEAGLVTDWNIAATRLLGWTRDEALGQSVSRLMIPPREQQAHATALRTFHETHVPALPSHPIQVAAQHRDGHQIPVELTVSRSQWQGTWRFHGFMRDITDRIEHEQQLTDLALTDPLTGLANRRAFIDRLDQAHARTRRHGTPLGVLYADVDHFKAINDTYGHAAGDSILRDVADRMRLIFRAEDTIGRLGGDEFAIVCEHFEGTFEELTGRVRRALCAPYTFRDQSILATVSIGLAVPSATDTTEHLLERADTSMYEAKAIQRL